MEKKKLVTGAFGFSGSTLIRELLNEGHKVVGTDISSRLKDPEQISLKKNIGLDINHPNLLLIESDLTNKGSLYDLFEKTGEIDIVYHTASLYSYKASLEDLRKINVEGTKNLISVLPDTISQYIHWSTCGVFGKPKHKGKNVNIPFNESSDSPKNMPENARCPKNTHIVNEYSISKWEQEQFLWKCYRENNLPLTIIRPAPIYGPGSTYGHGGIILSIYRGILPAIPLSSKNSITCSVHVEDIARFAMHISGKQEYIGEDFNVVDSSIISYHEFLHYIALLTGKNLIDIPFLPMSVMRFFTLTLSKILINFKLDNYFDKLNMVEPQSAKYIGSSYWISNKKSKTTGFTYKYDDVKEGLRETVKWLRDEGYL
ncbi:MAG: NAD(P)-dependent oxidoreductase [Saprospiraceae bacterium]|nr:NAD(P)-dependent oxidoreductase [Saprospiraceae bacterium]